MSKDNLKKVLIVEDDDLFLDAVKDHLIESYTVLESGSAEDAFTVLSKQGADVVLLDIGLPGLDGVGFLPKIKASWPVLPVIMMTAVDSIPQVVESMKKGAFDYLTKPINARELQLAIERALAAAELRGELEQRRSLQLMSNSAVQLIGSSPHMTELRQEIARVGPSDTSVLIQGETGTGKELVARGLHACSARADKPFVALNCGAIPRELLESELFGHKKGAFTGASKDNPGKFQLAHRGTLLLDEVGELAPEAQVKLLRVLEEREFYAVGGSELITVDVRTIASTNKNLKELVDEGKFRADLWFRLNVYTFEVLPLRERAEDIMDLTEHYMAHYARKSGKKESKLAGDAKELLLRHTWNGNARELRNVIERAVLFTEGTTIHAKHLRFMEVVSSPEPAMHGIQLPEGGIALEEVERSLLLQALKRAKYNKSKAAKLLNLTAPAFYYRLQKYDLK